MKKPVSFFFHARMPKGKKTHRTPVKFVREFIVSGFSLFFFLFDFLYASFSSHYTIERVVVFVKVDSRAVLTQLGDVLVWLLVRASESERRRAVAIPAAPVPPTNPVTFVTLYTSRSFPSLFFCSTSLSAQRSLAHFPSFFRCQTLTQYPIIYMADIFSFVPKKKRWVSVTDV